MGGEPPELFHWCYLDKHGKMVVGKFIKNKAWLW